MAIDVTIKSGGLLKKKLAIKDVILENMRYGIIDSAYRLDENKTGEYTIVFLKDHICRGYEISLKKGSIELRMPIPTSSIEISFFYDYIKTLCKKMNAKEFIKDGVNKSLGEIESCIKDDTLLSQRTLSIMKQDIDEGKYEYMYLFGVMNPISISKKDLVEINENLDVLGNFMNNIQMQDVYYSSPNIYKRKDGTTFGIYVITEDVTSVLPYRAKLFMTDQDIEIKDWYIGFVFDNQMAGACSYTNFLNNIKKDREYDVEHFIITLNKKQMQEVLEKYKEKI